MPLQLAAAFADEAGAIGMAAAVVMATLDMGAGAFLAAAVAAVGDCEHQDATVFPAHKQQQLLAGLPLPHHDHWVCLP